MIELKNLSKTYTTTKGIKVEALKNINLKNTQKRNDIYSRQKWKRKVNST